MVPYSTKLARFLLDTLKILVCSFSILNRSGKGLAYKDAVFVSPHKFVGGPETPGKQPSGTLKIAKASIFSEN